MTRSTMVVAAAIMWALLVVTIVTRFIAGDLEIMVAAIVIGVVVSRVIVKGLARRRSPSRG